MQKFSDTLAAAFLVRRINRFVAEVTFNNEKLNVYVPNTGRLSELALPGVRVLLSPINARYKYKILYIINKSFPVMIDSTYSNRLFHELLKEKKIPGFNQYKLIKSEPSYGNHRFDFLIDDGSNKTFIELKSCTLFHNKTGAFPDAVSKRASEHIKALAETGTGTLIFLVLKSDIEIFIPNYHTDFVFYETLKFFKSRINIHALTVQYDDQLKIQSVKEIPVIIPEVKPQGICILLLFNPEDKAAMCGEVLEQGYFIYCGRSDRNIFKTIASIKRKNGITSIISDIRFSEMKIITDIPVITESISTDDVKYKLKEKGGTDVFVNGQKDETPDKKIIYFKSNPAEESWFWDLILEMRFGEYC